MTTKIHMLAGDPDHGMSFELSAGNESDFSYGKKIIEEHSIPETVTHLIMDKGYASYEILETCKKKGIEAVVPPKSNFTRPWEYNKILYMYRNEIERHFHRLKNFRRIATRYDKLSVTYGSFVLLGMIALILRVLC